jgi:hypothetical protein
VDQEGDINPQEELWDIKEVILWDQQADIKEMDQWDPEDIRDIKVEVSIIMVN